MDNIRRMGAGIRAGLGFVGCGMLVACLTLCLPASVCAGEEDDPGGGTFTFYQENDIYAGTDRDYTNGLKLSWMSPDLKRFGDDRRLPSWSHILIDLMPFAEGDGFLKTISLSAGQNIYTPDDIQRREPDLGDRPYAGISYLALGFHSRNTRVMNTWEYTLGIIGPHSYAEDIQKVVHRWTDSEFPNGWDHQIKDEPLLNLFFDRKWRFSARNGSPGLGFDVIPHAGCSVGNALTATSVGSQARFGWNLPNDFGTLPIGPGSDTNAPLDNDGPRFSERTRWFSLHAFVSADVTAKLWDVTLDGNFFRSSVSVDKEPLVLKSSAGLGLVSGRLKVTYAYVAMTREYETQRQRQVYGTVTLSYTFR